jgi:hypothetical protein
VLVTGIRGKKRKAGLPVAGGVEVGVEHRVHLEALGRRHVHVVCLVGAEEDAGAGPAALASPRLS